MKIEINDPLYAEKMRLLDALYAVNDPELNINIVDLGLVYKIDLNDTLKQIIITMTLSTPSCPMGGMITQNVEWIAQTAFPGYTIKVELTFEPRWNIDMVSEAGRDALGG